MEINYKRFPGKLKDPSVASMIAAFLLMTEGPTDDEDLRRLVDMLDEEDARALWGMLGG